MVALRLWTCCGETVLRFPRSGVPTVITRRTHAIDISLYYSSPRDTDNANTHRRRQIFHSCQHFLTHASKRLYRGAGSKMYGIWPPPSAPGPNPKPNPTLHNFGHDFGEKIQGFLRTFQAPKTRSSAIAKGPRDASCQLKSCQLLRNNAETTCTTSLE